MPGLSQSLAVLVIVCDALFVAAMGAHLLQTERARRTKKTSGHKSIIETDLDVIARRHLGEDPVPWSRARLLLRKDDDHGS